MYKYFYLWLKYAWNEKIKKIKSSKKQTSNKQGSSGASYPIKVKHQHQENEVSWYKTSRIHSYMTEHTMNRVHQEISAAFYIIC